MEQEATNPLKRIGVLIAGSLLWDNDIRQRWRADRLAMDRTTRVKAPLRYGRISSSRRDTFTMTLDADSASGTAVVVPMISSVRTINDLILEAQVLWQAEAKARTLGPISSDWGTVSVLFRPGATTETLDDGWAAFFSENGSAIKPVDEDTGCLQIPWPTDADGSDLDSVDILLATANNPEGRSVSPVDIAQAWNRTGCEDYFFNNVAHGIRTAEDVAIWRQLDIRFRDFKEYEAAVRILQTEDRLSD